MSIISQKQLSLSDIYKDCQKIYENDKPTFLTLLANHIDLDEIVPFTFNLHFYASTGRPRKYSLYSMLWALIIQRIFSIPTDSLLILFLNYSKDLREFCGFDKVPDTSKITRFKQDFKDDLLATFNKLVDLTEPICHEINDYLASMSIFDSSGIEAYVTENNPKYTNTKVKQLKAYAKAMNYDSNYDPYKAAYGSMPPHASSNTEVKQLYIDGHFCYAYKFGIVTNGLGIVRHIAFYNKDYFEKHPEIQLEKKTDSPDEDKSVHDSKLLIPTLIDMFNAHPVINPHTFLGDSAFDTVAIYKQLLTGNTFGDNKCFQKAYIPLNSRSSPKYLDYTINEDGIPCCPNDENLPMKPEGNTSHLRCGLPTFKFVCPKMKWDKCEDGKYHRVCHCDNPCTTSKSGRMIYIYPEKELRTFPGTIRGTDEWDKTYKIRTNVERTINHFKSSYCLADRKTQNEDTLHADLILSGITQLVTVILANAIKHPELIRTIKSLVA